MDKKVRILMLENNAGDIESLEQELRRGGLSFTSKCVDTP